MRRVSLYASWGALFVLALGSTTGADDVQELRIRDKCDPVTFNKAIGPGTCIGDGNITIDAFIAELTEDQSVGAWRFNPDHFDMDTGKPLRVASRAGETHTFTRVAQFGGGFVAFLNALSGNPIPAPECAVVNPDGTLASQPPSPTNTFVTAGSILNGLTAGSATLPRGLTQWQCCIHPWMRTAITVR
jgi:hypothetical protein